MLRSKTAASRSTAVVGGPGGAAEIFEAKSASTSLLLDLTVFASVHIDSDCDYDNAIDHSFVIVPVETNVVRNGTTRDVASLQSDSLKPPKTLELHPVPNRGRKCCSGSRRNLK